MKVIHVLNHFLPEQIAGTEMYAFNMLEQLEIKGLEVLALIPNYGKLEKVEYFVGKIRVVKYPEPSFVDRTLIMGKKDAEGLHFFEEILKAEKPDIVHFHEIAGSNGITYRHVEVSKKMGFINVITMHLSNYSCKTGNLMYKDQKLCDGEINISKCTACCYKVKHNNLINTLITYPLSLALYSLGIDSTKLNNRIGTGLGFPFLIKKLKTDLHKLVENCDALIVLTKWYKSILEKNDVPAEKLFHISQGLTLQKEIVNCDISIKTEVGLKIIFIGRISAFKGLHILIDALTNIGDQPVFLDIYGQDFEDQFSQQLKISSKEMNNVQWKGKLEPGNVVATISNYDILCLPSTFSEMSPLVIQEAFAAKVPVLASDVYGNAEQIVKNKNGWLFKFKDAIDLKLKIEYLLNNPLAIKTAKENIKSVKSFGIVADEQLEIYKRLFNN